MSVNTLCEDTTCIHSVSTLHFILYKLPTPQRSVTEMVGKQTSQPDGNKLLLGCHDCLPRTKYKESSNSKHNLSRLTLRRLVFRIATHFVWTFGLATRNTSQFPTLYIKLLQVPRNKRGSYRLTHPVKQTAAILLDEQSTILVCKQSREEHCSAERVTH